MGFHLKVINPIFYPGWDELLVSTRRCNFFHSSSWARVLSGSYGFNPVYFTAFDNGRLFALIPVMEISSLLTGRRGVSLPFTDYCDPILPESIQHQQILEQVIQHGRSCRWRFMELRGAQNLLPSIPTSATYIGHTLDLFKDEGKIYSDLRDSTRRNIKKAVAAGVEVKLSNSIESIREFYRLNCMTRKQHGLPPQPYYFFENIYEIILSKNFGIVALGSSAGKNIAGAVFFHFNGKAIYKYGASDRVYQHLRANNLVMWEGIRWYCKNGYESLCLGRTEAKNIGLRQFKNGWGTREHEICYYKYDFSRNAFLKNQRLLGSKYTTLLGKIPSPVLELVGNLLYRHMG